MRFFEIQSAASLLASSLLGAGWMKTPVSSNSSRLGNSRAVAETGDASEDEESEEEEEEESEDDEDDSGDCTFLPGVSTFGFVAVVMAFWTGGCNRKQRGGGNFYQFSRVLL